MLPKTNFDPSAPNWTGASRQPERSNYQVNKTFETLFSGIGDAVTGAANTGYGFVVDKLKNAWEQELEPVRDAQGVGDFRDNMDANRAAQRGQAQPPEVQSYAERAAKLQAAHAEGRISPTYYLSQLTSMTKEMKSRFPGFKDEVDAVVQKTTGVVPANALRLAILDQLQQNQSEAQKKAQEEDKKVEANMRYAPPSILAKAARGEKVSWAELAPHAHQAQAEDQQMSAAKSRLDLLDKQGKATTEEAIKVTQGVIDTETSRIFDKATDAVGGPQSTLMKAISSGKPLAGPELEAVKGQLVVFKQQYQVMLDKIFESPSGESGRSMSQLIGDPTKIKQLKEQAMEKVTRLEQLITDDHVLQVSGHQRAP
jgi:plastocyanin